MTAVFRTRFSQAGIFSTNFLFSLSRNSSRPSPSDRAFSATSIVLQERGVSAANSGFVLSGGMRCGCCCDPCGANVGQYGANVQLVQHVKCSGNVNRLSIAFDLCSGDGYLSLQLFVSPSERNRLN
ncbi:hypothetical protein Trydic_g2241 [Trypoxylus dichotomus]